MPTGSYSSKFSSRSVFYKFFQLCKYGIDLCYQLNGDFRTPLTKALREAKDKLIDAIKVRSIDDKWIPTNLRSKSGLARCLQEHSELGLNLEGYVTGTLSIAKEY